MLFPWIVISGGIYAFIATMGIGANDVANGIGPFVAIYTIGKTGEVNEKNEMGKDSLYILIAGGLGISLGLALYGFKIIKALGIKLCKITPSDISACLVGSEMCIRDRCLDG